ncbi:MAG TPA: hypothetical protein VMF31_10525 [Solirubrobacterales bacterium]|nr:hypothetical protein [Solirubrobacterales bacterium]
MIWFGIALALTFAAVIGFLNAERKTRAARRRQAKIRPFDRELELENPLLMDAIRFCRGRSPIDLEEARSRS